MIGIIFYCISPSNRHQKCLEIVLSNEPDVNNKSKEGVPVLIFACETAKENEDLCMMLIDKGADVNCRVEVNIKMVEVVACTARNFNLLKLLAKQNKKFVNIFLERM